MDFSLEEAIHLAAEDLKSARTRLGVTTQKAAKQAGLSIEYYRALERGLVSKSGYVLCKLISVCRRLDIESVRFSYIDEIEQYANLDMSSDLSSGRIITFLDTLEANIAELEDIECYLSPDIVFRFFEHNGFKTLLTSRKRTDKQMVEMLNGATFSMCLDNDKDYYVMPVKDDPPDVELLVVDRDRFLFEVVRLEITIHGKYSDSLFETISKKLKKRYHKGTILVVMVEGIETFEAAEMVEFIQKNNPHNHELVLIGGTGREGEFLVSIPSDHVICPDSGKTTILERDIFQDDRSTGFRGYPGVFHGYRGIPLFIKEVKLT